MTTKFNTAFQSRETARFEMCKRFCAERAAAAGKPLKIEITLKWNGRFTNRLGDAQLFRKPGYTTVTNSVAPALGTIRLAKKLWPLATEAKRRNTMIHELAHLYAEAEKTNANHGPVWKKWMRLFGEDPERCYAVNADTFGENATAVLAAKRPWQGACDCGQPILCTTKLRNAWCGISSGRSRRRPRGFGQTRLCTKCRKHLTKEWALTNLKNKGI